LPSSGRNQEANVDAVPAAGALETQVRTPGARFLLGASSVAQLPRLTLPTVAFAGRSNVGKSSLLNSLVRQRKLARVSKRPGRTQQINFFLVDERIVFADLPGYGFARVPLIVQAQWKTLVEGFLASTIDLRLVAVLVDSRRGLQTEDIHLLDYLAGLRLRALVVATKSDKLNRNQRRESLEALRADAAIRGAALSCSAATGEGIADLWTEIERSCLQQRTTAMTPRARG
jgi:GTP-binding protein